ncbi:site-2 protease family protein [Haloquadratum walsbyi]|jgi:Predicted membrane-associated Zn-dependent proteases 1|uniref:Putative membrane-associated Zn-dependent proteases 1 n=1 Tax=Haloquadratum walsbyi J07HQW2 TaxID=1238425 RepID=U1NG52_9EURY|nr:site-2 protease family protein [Haloquadratum walsbyi]ERG96095.1 MAG: putative membrane-associated Zn-dependent proteases 1 [Haloquadratum walsbyi J07HQW2]
MNTLLWVLVGLAAYSAGTLFLSQRGLVPEFIKVQGPFTTIHTQRGRDFIEWIAQPKRFWRAWTNFGVGTALVIMTGMFAFLLIQGISILQNPPAPSAVNQPENFLVIPGVNDFLPLSVAPEIIFGLLVGLIVHEGGHGILCRVEGIEIESMGVFLLTIIPLGAFVEPDEESEQIASRGGKTRMFAAGVTNNFAITIIAFAVLFGPIIGSIAVAPGLAVSGAYDESPAATAGIEQGDRITTVAGTTIDNEGELNGVLAETTQQEVTVKINDGASVAGRESQTVTVERALIVAGSVGGNPADINIDTEGDPIGVDAVNGKAVYTQAGFVDAVGTDRFVELTTTRGTTTIPAGAYLTRIASDGPLAQAGVPSDPGVIVTAIDGQRIVSSNELTEALDTTQPGQEVVVEAVVSGEVQEYTVRLGENPQDGTGFLGVNIFPGTSGLLLTDFGAQSYPAGTYLELLGGEGGPGSIGLSGTIADSPLGAVYVSLVLPLASVVLGIPNFPGFTGAVHNFYTISGPLEPLGSGVFLIANLAFWTAWINLQLGIFNFIPGHPLDGGRILRTSAEAIVSRLPLPANGKRRVVRTITTSVGIIMLMSLLLLVFGPSVLSG